MGPANCAVIGSFNHSKKLKKLSEEYCLVHVGMLKKDCGCPPPFRLYMFPLRDTARLFIGTGKIPPAVLVKPDA